VLASAATIGVLLCADTSDAAVFGVHVQPVLLWFFLGIGHIYFFAMWRITTVIENDTDKKFWNMRGLWKQAVTGGTTGFPGKTKAQLLLIRALVRRAGPNDTHLGRAVISAALRKSKQANRGVR
jgi:hypothetical protein